MGLMSNSDLDKAVALLKKRYQGCSNCGALGVAMHDIVGLPLLERMIPSGITLSKETIAVIPLICNSCGFVTLFAAKDFAHLE